MSDESNPAPASLPRRILLADADAFYVAIARLVDPEGAGRVPLLIVGGSADGRGVVTSASYEAREYGVRSAMPTAQALRLCPGATVVPVPREVCSTKSREILNTLEQFTPVVEPASIDEFYLDLTGTEALYQGQTLEALATTIRTAVLDTTSLAVSIGGGTSRLVAKLAAKQAKPRPGRAGTGVFIVPPGGEADFLRDLELAAIPGIGPKFQDHLARFQLRTVRDVLRHDQPTLEQWLGQRQARWLYRRVRGIDSTPIASHPLRKSISSEETFARDLERDEDLERELLHLAVGVAAQLRGKGFKARTVTVKLRDADFTTRQASRTLPRAVATDRTIVATGRALLGKLRRARHTPARLIGIAVSQLEKTAETAVQLDIFADAQASTLETERDRHLAEVVDTISEKFGRRGLVRGSEVARRR